MRINTNISAMNSWRNLSSVNTQLTKSLERLSSGLRINRAADDAAGLSISENLRTQVRGQQQALKNVQDGISMVNIADGGLNEIASLLQRGRELAVQAANDTLGAAERQALQEEADQINLEIDRICQSTTFNGINLLQSSKYSDADRQLVLDALQNGALKDAYDKVIAAYGFTHAAVPNLEVEFVDSDSFAAAYVSYSTPIFNPASLSLTVVLDWAVPLAQAGNIDAIENVIAHEMVHAMMAEETNMFAFPDWFQEGAAEFVIGADSRVSSALASMGGDTPANRTALANLITSNATEMSSSNHYAAAYLATKYLDDRLRNAGYAGGLGWAMQNVLDDTANDLNDVLALPGMVDFGGAPYADQDDFLADFKANFAAWSALPGNLNLGNADRGAITGSDYGFAAQDTVSVVTTTGSTADPTPWNEVWPTSEGQQVVIQTGANKSQELTLNLTSVTSGSLGVNSVDLTTQATAGSAITAYDTAIGRVSQARATLGAQSNQMEHTMANLATSVENQAAAESRIRDSDMAALMTAFTRQQILSESATGVLAQANLKEALILDVVA